MLTTPERIETPLVSLRGAGLQRSGRWLVRGVDLDIRPGEIVTMIGPNGSGKSTTARLITGVVRPSGGSVTRRPGLKVGYVPQKLGVDWTLPLSVRRLMSLTGPQSPADIADALESVGISHLAEAEVQRLSGGEFQRALLARAIVRRPDLLVLDEPVQGVDFAGEAALYELILKIRDSTGCGILLISHDLHVVMAATDTVICLNGHVCCRGSPQAVAESPEYLSMFGGAATLAVYRHEHDHVHLADGRVRRGAGSIAGHGEREAGDCGCHDHGEGASAPEVRGAG